MRVNLIRTWLSRDENISVHAVRSRLNCEMQAEAETVTDVHVEYGAALLRPRSLLHDLRRIFHRRLIRVRASGTRVRRATASPGKSECNPVTLGRCRRCPKRVRPLEHPTDARVKIDTGHDVSNSHATGYAMLRGVDFNRVGLTRPVGKQNWIGRRRRRTW